MVVVALEEGGGEREGAQVEEGGVGRIIYPSIRIGQRWEMCGLCLEIEVGCFVAGLGLRCDLLIIN